MIECLVITTPQDEAVKAVVASVPGARVFETNDFFAHNARFNKGLCVERGFDVLGRHGLILIHDADILFPDSLPLDQLRLNVLHGARRRVLEDPRRWRPDFNWLQCPQTKDGSAIGFFQLFAADDPSIQHVRPWYDVTFAHAGGGDARFLEHWPPSKRTVLPMDVLHLGPIDSHWFGVDQAGKDMMAAFVHRNGWRRAMAKADPSAVRRVGEIVERVEVPGFPKSTYELPFVKRAQAARKA